MINIGINPDIARLGPLTLAWHGLFSAVAGVAAVWLASRLAAKWNVDKGQLYGVLLWAIPGGLVGGRAVFVIDYWDSFSQQPLAIFALQEGGTALWGAILGGMITAAIYARVRGYRVGTLMDIGAIGMVLGQAIGRVGDIINGEHISAATTLPWGFVYTHPLSPSYGLPAQHPAVAYEMLMDLAIFGLLWRLKGRLQPSGSLSLLYLSLYSLGRFFLSFLRQDSHFVALGLNQAQWLSLVVLMLALSWLVSRIGKRSPASSGGVEKEVTDVKAKEG
ncbi:MAG: prolipoprotein diacylglyceryl transferase [Chloroflexi bacterium]|nr:prolipoprotein diacylglyceryl transferase [Chloroflexota bacterium]